MNKEELANVLDGCEYGAVISKDLASKAKEHGLVVVYGASDDLMELEGAIRDEIGCWEGGTCFVGAEGAIHKEPGEGIFRIDALWDQEGFSWTYRTDIPHATFEVLEDGEEKYCRGFVFSLNDLKHGQ